MPLYCDGDENATCKYAFALSRPHLNVCIWWYIVLRWHFFSCHYISKTIMWKPANFTFSFIFFMFITQWVCFVFVTISSVRLTSNHCCLLERSWVWRLFFCSCWFLSKMAFITYACSPSLTFCVFPWISKYHARNF